MKICLLHYKEDIERSREKAGFSREPQVKQAEQLISSTSIINDPKPIASVDTEGFFCAEPTVISSSSDNENFCPRLPFNETDSQIQNIDYSAEFSHTGFRSDSLVSIRLGDKEDERDSTSEEIVMIRHNMGVRHSDNIMV